MVWRQEKRELSDLARCQKKGSRQNGTDNNLCVECSSPSGALQCCVRAQRLEGLQGLPHDSQNLVEAAGEVILVK